MKPTAQPVQPVNKTLPPALHDLARECLWIAYVWNDHNFEYAHSYAKKIAIKHGINSFEDANVWLAAQSVQPADEALRKDAERYRWLRDKGSSTWRPLQSQWRMNSSDRCDATVDAAMQPAQGNQMNWQPIETAPLDGTGILLWSSELDEPTIGRWSIEHEHLRQWWVDAWAPPEFNKPTHWMPLPVPPTKE